MSMLLRRFDAVRIFPGLSLAVFAQAPFAGALGSAPAKPFFGFLVLGVLAAAVQALNARRARRVGKRRVSRL